MHVLKSNQVQVDDLRERNRALESENTDFRRQLLQLVGVERDA